MEITYHPQLGTIQYDLTTVSDDPLEQVTQVIGLMRRYAIEDAQSPIVQDDLARVLADITDVGLDPTDSKTPSDAAKVDAIFWHVRRRVTFAQDEQDLAPLQSITDTPLVELLVRPAGMIGMPTRIGDCDDFAMYTASLLLAAGIPNAYVTIAADPTDPSRFSHVYNAAYIDGKRLALDASFGDYPGWETQDTVYMRREWPLDAGVIARAWPWVAAALVGAGVAWIAGTRRTA